MKRKAVKIIAWTLGTILLLTLAFFANAFFGNPVSGALARRSARQLLAREHPGTDYVIRDVGYNFKTGGYWIQIESPSSPDGAFAVYTDGLGRYSYDTFEEMVLRRGNTARRLDMAYRAAGDAVFDAPDFPLTRTWNSPSWNLPTRTTPSPSRRRSWSWTGSMIWRSWGPGPGGW